MRDRRLHAFLDAVNRLNFDHIAHRPFSEENLDIARMWPAIEEPIRARYNRSVLEVFDLETPSLRRARWTTLGKLSTPETTHIHIDSLAERILSHVITIESLLQSGHAYRSANGLVKHEQLGRPSTSLSRCSCPTSRGQLA